jgi:hypothetical protein
LRSSINISKFQLLIFNLLDGPFQLAIILALLISTTRTLETKELLEGERMLFYEETSFVL